MTSARCKVCYDRATKDLVDTCLLNGQTPAEVLRLYGESLSLSSSGLYRHAKFHQPASALRVDWADLDTTSGELLADLGGLRRRSLQEAERQRRVGQHTASRGYASIAISATAEMHRQGATDDDKGSGQLHWDQVRRSLQRLALDHPETIDLLAAAAHHLDFDDLVEDFETLAARARELRTN